MGGEKGEKWEKLKTFSNVLLYMYFAKDMGQRGRNPTESGRKQEKKVREGVK